MPRPAIYRIREKVRLHQYDMSSHAMEEMAEDGLDILDVENALLDGQITRTEKGDPRGTKYCVEGLGWDCQTRVGVVGRFANNRRFLIITVYEIGDITE